MKPSAPRSAGLGKLAKLAPMGACLPQEFVRHALAGERRIDEAVHRLAQVTEWKPEEIRPMVGGLAELASEGLESPQTIILRGLDRAFQLACAGKPIAVEWAPGLGRMVHLAATMRDYESRRLIFSGEEEP